MGTDIRDPDVYDEIVEKARHDTTQHNLGERNKNDRR